MADKRIGSNPLSRPDPVDTMLSTSIEKSRNSIQSKQRIMSVPSIQSIQEGERPLRREAIKKDASRAGLPKGWTRFSFIVRDDYEEKVKALAFWNRRGIKETMNEIIRQYLAKKSVSSILDEAMEAYKKRRS
jgi:hypothetical protein